MTNKKLADIKIIFERIIEKAEKIKDNKKLTGDEREAIIKGLKEEFTNALVSLEYCIDTPAWRDRAFEIQESFCHKAIESGIIKDKNELELLFIEVSEIKKAKEEDGDELKAIKKEIDKAIKAKDVKKLAYISYETIKERTKLSDDTEQYLFEKLYNTGLEEEVDKLSGEISGRAEEKKLREWNHELKEHEARLRTLERDRKKELKKEYADVSKRAGSYYKTIDAVYKDVSLAPPEFESPGICQKCGKPIEETFYYFEPATDILMHSDCAKKAFDIKKKVKKHE